MKARFKRQILLFCAVLVAGFLAGVVMDRFFHLTIGEFRTVILVAGFLGGIDVVEEMTNKRQFLRKLFARIFYLIGIVVGFL